MPIRGTPRACGAQAAEQNPEAAHPRERTTVRRCPPLAGLRSRISAGWQALPAANRCRCPAPAPLTLDAREGASPSRFRRMGKDERRRPGWVPGSGMAGRVWVNPSDSRSLAARGVPARASQGTGRLRRAGPDGPGGGEAPPDPPCTPSRGGALVEGGATFEGGAGPGPREKDAPKKGGGRRDRAGGTGAGGLALRPPA